MFGECHAHIIMDGVNYRQAIDLHRNGPDDNVIREHLKIYQDRGITFVRDGGDALGVSARAKELAPEYGIDYRTPVFAIHKEGHYGSIVGKNFSTMPEFHKRVLEAKEQGLTREIGISNFTIPLMERAIAAVGKENIATNQIELSPYLQNHKVVDWAKQHGVHITSYMTLAYGKALKDEVIARIAEKHNATAAQVILAWAMGEGYAVIPSSTKRENLASNLLVRDLQLDDEDKNAIAALECNDRLVSPEGLAPDWD